MLSIEVSGLLVRRACAYDDGTDTITPSIECRLDVNPVRDEDGENNRRRGIPCASPVASRLPARREQISGRPTARRAIAASTHPQDQSDATFRSARDRTSR